MFTVVVQRPPSLAQKGVYHVPSRGPGQLHHLGNRTRPFSAKARVTTEKISGVAPFPPVTPKPRTPWIPFSGFASLSKPKSDVKVDPLKDVVQTEEELLNLVPEVYQNR